MLEFSTERECNFCDVYVNKNGVSSSSSIRKIICRYGRGCTHYNDAVHKEQFWHPSVAQIDEDRKLSHNICNECGFASDSLQELQLHLKRKTAWSNNSLVGCRISCLIDNKEWHEGIVTQFHRSGKHFIEFRMIGERRWLNMKKIAFYIVERPAASSSSCSSEYKDSEPSSHGKKSDLAPIEDDWVYVDDITLEYTFAQSILFKVYGTTIQETGHKTKGHICLTDEDRRICQQVKGSLLYGELLPRGVNKALGSKRLNAQEATTLFDLGMGTGKVIIQAFLQFRNLNYVFGIELSEGRFSVAESAAMKMIEIIGKESFEVNAIPGKSIEIIESYVDDKGDHRRRILKMECNDMFSLDLTTMSRADIIMLETDIPNHLQDNLYFLLSKVREGAHALTYLDLRKHSSYNALHFRQLESNKSLSDRFPTSWSVQRGHHFFLWVKDSRENSKHLFSGSSTSIFNESNNDSTSEYEGRNSKFKSSKNTNDSLTSANKPWGCLPFNLRSFFS